MTEDSSNQIDNKFVIEHAKNQYNNLLNFIDSEHFATNGFSWRDHRHLNIYCIYTIDYKESGLIDIFAIENSTKDEFIFIDGSPKTKDSYEYRDASMSGDVKRQFAFFKANNIFDLGDKEILDESYLGVFADNHISQDDVIRVIDHWIDTFVGREYRKTVKTLSEKPDNLIKISEKNFFADMYHFSDMLNNIGNEQLEDELYECLFAYNRNKWYISACGLGGVLEHLLYLTIKNYGKEKKLGKTPSAADYVSVLSKDCLKEEFTSKDFTYLNICFNARNAVDHFRAGQTSKNLCDIILNGISSSYNDYYLDSLAYHKSH